MVKADILKDALDWAEQKINHDAIEKACEWFSYYLFEIGYPDDWKRDSENIISGERILNQQEKLLNVQKTTFGTLLKL